LSTSWPTHRRFVGQSLVRWNRASIAINSVVKGMIILRSADRWKACNDAGEVRHSSTTLPSGGYCGSFQRIIESQHFWSTARKERPHRKRASPSNFTCVCPSEFFHAQEPRSAETKISRPLLPGVSLASTDLPSIAYHWSRLPFTSSSSVLNCSLIRSNHLLLFCPFPSLPCPAHQS